MSNRMSEDIIQDVEVHTESPIEQEARQFNWVPLEEYKGDPSEWKDAETFMKRGREINGFLRKDLEKIKAELDKRNAELSEIKSATEEFKKFHAETEERAYKRALDELKAQRKEALQEQDFERLDEIEEQLDALKENKPTKQEKKVETTSQEPDPVFVEWMNENDWIKDPELDELATGIAAALRSKGESSTGRIFLDKVKERVKKYAPEKFENTNRSKPSMVDSSSSTRQVDGKKKTYNDLPEDAKKACDKYVKAGLLTKDQYVQDYFA